jgi:2',3'-cyclic-nucleotide 2'-phosphodiesterase (5'-nucleotidase family)
MAQRFTQVLLICLVLVSIVLSPKKAEAKAATIADFIIPRGFTFNVDLVKGTTTIPDVYFLQNLLNISTSTRVSEIDALLWRQDRIGHWALPEDFQD